jgi:hypothetical protein
LEPYPALVRKRRGEEKGWKDELGRKGGEIIKGDKRGEWKLK